MKKVSDVFKSIRYAKGETRDKPHKSTDDEGHYTVGEKEYNQQLQHVKKMAMQEEIKDKTDIGEYDQEGDMAKSDLRSIIANAQKMHDMIDDADNLPEWVQSKITKAEDYISTVANYMASEMSEEVMQEGRPSQRHPLEGHEYHKKTNAELEYIAKDAHKAAEAMKSHNTTAENKYRDQANDSATVRHFRKTSGMPDWYKKKYGHMNEEMEQIDEKNVPTSPEKWAQAKSQAKAKFDVYPSAYANGWAAKKYKEMGGGWKSVSESNEKPPFDPDPKPRKKMVVAGKHGEGYSTARHLARMAMQKQSEKMKKPIKEEEMSKKAQIVKGVAKKKKESAETFQKDPIISKSEVKM